MNSLLKHLRICDLEVFITAMHFKNLSKAAQMHNLTQSAASAIITRVESAFGKALCHHEKRQFRPTHEGEILLQKIEQWLVFFKENIAAQTSLPLRLVTTNAIARAILPSILPYEQIDLKIMRPDYAYNAIMKNEADLAIVLDNSPWKNLNIQEIGKGEFGLYSKKSDTLLSPILLPENQIETLTFMQRWKDMHDFEVPIKARIPSWSLIADLCSNSNDVGFLPDFLANKFNLTPVNWQPPTSGFKILGLYKESISHQTRIQNIISLCTQSLI